MTYSITYNDLISKIHNKINQYREGSKLISKREVEDFIYFLRKSNWDGNKMISTLKKIDLV